MSCTYLVSSKTKTLAPLENKIITLYSCGPTIYDHTHSGHASYYLYFDIIRDVLTYLEHTIIYCMNITDVDDKIQNKLKPLNISHKKLITKYEKEIFDDINSLNILRPTYII